MHLWEEGVRASSGEGARLFVLNYFKHVFIPLFISNFNFPLFFSNSKVKC